MTGIDCVSKAVLICSLGSVCVTAMAAGSHLSGAKNKSSNAAIPVANRGEFGKLPLSFEANHGQADAVVKFLSRGEGYALYLTDSGATMVLGRSPACNGVPRQTASPVSGEDRVKAAQVAPSAPCKNSRQDVVRMALAGALHRPGVSSVAVGEERLPGKVNYFIGNDPTKWHSDLPTFAKVRYGGVYPGVDLVYYGDQGQLEYDFVVAPGADPRRVRLKFAGQKRLTLGANGDLVLTGESGQATVQRPVVYQIVDGRREAVSGRFRLAADDTVGFQLGRYNRARPLVIDPVLSYSTYLGGTGTLALGIAYRGDQGNAITVDASGDAYVTGTAWSTNFPLTPGSYQSKNENALNEVGPSVFVTKFNATGTELVYSTYLGGLGNGDYGNAIAVDSAGNAYITGQSSDANFPVTKGAFQTVNHDILGTDPFPTGFVTKLNPKGNGLVYSTYLGGSPSPSGFPSYDSGEGIALDSDGNAYVAGFTLAPDFPTTAGAFQQNYVSTAGASNAFVAKLNPTGTALVYSTYLGGSGLGGSTSYGDQASSIAIDSAGDAFVAGFTNSVDFPVTPGAFQKVYRGGTNQSSNAFVTELNPGGAAEVYSTFLGGSGQPAAQARFGASGDVANGIAVDGSGNVYTAGTTYSADFPLAGGLNQATVPLAGVGFVAKFNASLSALNYSTLVAGPYSSVAGLAVDGAGKAYITGVADVDYFASTPDALPPPNISNREVPFLTKLNAAGDAAEFSSVLGGTGSDFAYGLTLDGDGSVYVTGATGSTDFPITSGAFQTVNRAATRGVYGNDNAFVSKFALAGDVTDYFGTLTTISASPMQTQLGQHITFTAKVASSPGAGTPTGQVGFYADPLGSPVPELPVSEALNSSGVATFSISTLAPGQYRIGAKYPGDGSHLPSLVDFYANEALVRVIGPPANILYGNGYEYNFTYGGFVNQPLKVVVTDAANYPLQGVTVNFSGTGLSFSSPTAVTGANGYATVNFVAHQAGTLAAIASVSGIATSLSIPIEVQPAPLTVYVNSTWRVYGGANPTLASTLAGLIGSDTVIVTEQTAADAKSPVGIYPITATVSGADAANYSITVNQGSLYVNKALLHVEAANVNVTYGDVPAQPTAYGFYGFLNGDTASVVSGEPVLSTSVTSTTAAGRYPIQVQLGTLTAANYSFTDISNGEGAVTVYKRTLQAIANNQTMHQGGPVPTLTYSFTGFVNGDTPASAISGAPAMFTTATSSSPPGEYPISGNLGTLVSTNYTFERVNGVMTVLP